MMAAADPDDIGGSSRQPPMRSNSPDNFQTEPAALDWLLPHIPRHWKIWEPACGNGNLAKRLREEHYKVSATDIISGHDFMSWRLPADEWDCAITNPPFSIKEKFLGRCYHLGKPFALLMPLTTFDAIDRRQLMAEHGVEVILPPRRINFETPNHARNVAEGKRTSAWFYSVWITHGLRIGRQLVFTDA
jgi:hypothetical protein